MVEHGPLDDFDEARADLAAALQAVERAVDVVLLRARDVALLLALQVFEHLHVQLGGSAR